MDLTMGLTKGLTKGYYIYSIAPVAITSIYSNLSLVNLKFEPRDMLKLYAKSTKEEHPAYD